MGNNSVRCAHISLGIPSLDFLAARQFAAGVPRRRDPAHVLVSCGDADYSCAAILPPRFFQRFRGEKEISTCLEDEFHAGDIYVHERSFLVFVSTFSLV